MHVGARNNLVSFFGSMLQVFSQNTENLRAQQRRVHEIPRIFIFCLVVRTSIRLKTVQKSVYIFFKRPIYLPLKEFTPLTYFLIFIFTLFISYPSLRISFVTQQAIFSIPPYYFSPTGTIQSHICTYCFVVTFSNSLKVCKTQIASPSENYNARNEFFLIPKRHKIKGDN